MKKILLLLIMLVNLQVVIRCNYIGVGCGLTASAQHMTREAGDNCQDDEDGLWYYYANMALCNNGPEILGYPCHYCNQANDSEEERRLHEWCCPYNPDNQAPWWDDNGGSNGGDGSGGGTSYGTSGVGGSGSEQAPGNSNQSSQQTSNDKSVKFNKFAQEAIDYTLKKYESAAACNIGVQFLFKKIFGYLDSSLDHRANGIADAVKQSPNWLAVNCVDDAIAEADKGYFVIAVWKNPKGGSGHIIAFLPNANGRVMDTGPDGVGKTTEHGWTGSFSSPKRPSVKFYKYKNKY